MCCSIYILLMGSFSFLGMKVYVTEEQELIMEPSLKWAGNPNITVVVKAYGLKATAQVIEICLFLRNFFVTVSLYSFDPFLWKD